MKYIYRVRDPTLLCMAAGPHVLLNCYSTEYLTDQGIRLLNTLISCAVFSINKLTETLVLKYYPEQCYDRDKF